MPLTIEDIATFCKKKGFVYPSSEIYGGISGFWDYGPLGAELFNNIKASWWKFFVQDREDMVGIDASIISHPRVWKASGHLDCFGDLVLKCSKCAERLRADHFIEDVLHMNVEGMDVHKINLIIKDNNLNCPKCKSKFEELRDFNLLFKTFVGADESKSSEAYLRGETAQGMFVDFKLIAETSRMKLPFGIAQVGKCFRNEISPRDFMFRSREFSIAEFEYFIHPDVKQCILLDKTHSNVKFNLLTSEVQAKHKDTLKETSISAMLNAKKLDEWHAYWLAEQVMWFKELGLDLKNFKIREHTKDELSHYSSATFDFDYQYPFGSKEVAGNANRGQYDLNQHVKESKQKMELFDEETKQKVIPRVIEPTFGMERVFLAIICDAYTTREDKEGNEIVVLKLAPKLAPFKVAVFPLVNKLDSRARKVYDLLRKEFACFYDKSGAIGRRYVRQDEIGTPYCVTVDFESEKSVTLRDRDTMKQVRVPIKDLKETISKLIKGEIKFSSAGKEVK